MSWTPVTTLDGVWSSSPFPMWLTLALASLLAVLVFLTLVRADKSVANVVLTVIALLAIGIAAAATISPGGGRAFESKNPAVPLNVAMPALACIDGLAGDVVEVACEKALFATPDAAAAAVSYAASKLSRLRSFGEVAGADGAMSPELQALRRAIERDRYGLVAHVLAVRDHCRPSDCAAFQVLTDRSRIAANMEEGTYEKLVARYAPSWNAHAEMADTQRPGLPPMPALGSEPTGKPTTAEFPSAASIPPVSIMTPEPPTGAAAPSPASPLATTQQAVPKPRPAPVKKPAAPKAHAVAPVRLTPEPPSANPQQD
ncbi:hypothetical protein [Nitrobacter sp.]|uniref:hypothetical protein n=1 Tax=Nitrobacter sp. TaxID=29420 RepID=UPI0029CAB3B2|nr:hypothetical protein [Nitrobacter sp.]